MQRPYRPKRKVSARRDVLALGLTIAGIIMFVGTGAPALAQIVRQLRGVGMGPDRIAIEAVLLNIALLIFAWRRYIQMKGEVAQREKAEEELRRMAETDALTGSLNRRSIGPATDRLIGEAHAHGEILAFVMVDLDGFKQINDYHGHTAGDAILQEVTQRITALLPQRSLFGRLGGDEFAFAFPFQANRSDTVDRLAAAVTESVSRAVVVNGTAIDITCSLGLARSDAKRISSDSPADAQTLLHMADIALFHAKKQGRNRYFWFEAPMESELRFRGELESGIRRGIQSGEFVPFYEQQVNLKTGRLVGFEMLARWNSPQFGWVSPEVFIPVAEEIGVISDLSECLIRQALKDAREWDTSIGLSVNISPIQLRDPWFAQRLLKMLVEANFPPSRLEIEITESCLHDNIGAVRTLITSLKNQGVRVSLDDFGTGYSSLSQLRTLPFDQIKIDRSFVTNMHENNDSATIVKAIASLGKGLGLPITAEGIETETVLGELQAFGEIKGQGYLYGKPEPADLTRQRLAALDLLVEKQRPVEEAAPEAEGQRRRAVGE